jgi:hypothetical protein
MNHINTKTQSRILKFDGILKVTNSVVKWNSTSEEDKKFWRREAIWKYATGISLRLYSNGIMDNVIDDEECAREEVCKLLDTSTAELKEKINEIIDKHLVLEERKRIIMAEQDL